MKTFERYAEYYDLFYGNKDYSKEAEIIDKLIRGHIESSSCKKLINLGCGTGRHDRELIRYGWELKGIDLSDEMVEIAKENSKNFGIEYEVGDIRNYNDYIKYDACTSLFHVMSYQNSNDDLVAAFSTANRELRLDGVFLFDCWYGPGVLSDKPSVRIKKVENENSIFIRNAIPEMHADKNTVDVNYEVLVVDKETGVTSNIKETHKMRYFFTPEIDYLLNECGFVLLDCIDCNTLQSVTYDSWTAYFIARKVREL